MKLEQFKFLIAKQKAPEVEQCLSSLRRIKTWQPLRSNLQYPCVNNSDSRKCAEKQLSQLGATNFTLNRQRDLVQQGVVHVTLV